MNLDFHSVILTRATIFDPIFLAFENPLLFCITAVVLIILIITILIIVRKKRNFKEKKLIPLINNTLDGLTFDPNRELLAHEMEKIFVLKEGNANYGEVYISGNLSDNIYFKCCYMTLMKKIAKEAYRSFKGSIFQFQFKNKFSVKIGLYPHNILSKTYVNHDKLTKLETENVKFNNTFSAYSEDNQKALLVLTPQKLEQILNIKNYFNKDVIICFNNDSLYIIVPDYKYFKTPKFFANEKTINKLLYNLKDRISKITDLIMMLELDK